MIKEIGLPQALIQNHVECEQRKKMFVILLYQPWLTRLYQIK